MAKEPLDTDTTEKPERERDPFLDAVGHKIRVARVQAGLTQKQLGVAIDTKQGWVFLVEDGQNNIPLNTLRKIAEALNTDPRNLLPGPSDFVTAPRNATLTTELIKEAISDTTQLLNRLHKAAVLSEG